MNRNSISMKLIMYIVLMAGACFAVPLPTEFPINMGFKTLHSDNDQSTAGNEPGGAYAFDTIANATNFFPVHHGMLCDMPSLNPFAITIVANPPAGINLCSTNFDARKVWPGNLLYYAGSTATAAFAATDLQIYVADVSVFSNTCKIDVVNPNGTVTKVTRRDVDDIVVIYTNKSPGIPNWDTAELAQLFGYNIAYKNIHVRRGKGETAARAFPAGAYIAPVVAAWENNGSKTSQLFRINYSLHAPKNTNPATGGSTAGVQANEWAATNMANGLVSSGLDGVEHDEMFNNYNGDRAIDCNNDGKADWGYFNGINSFGLGVQEYARILRAKAQGKIIQFDSDYPDNGYRGFNFINGIQMETFEFGKPENFSEAYEHLSHWVIKAVVAPKFSYGYCRAQTKLYHADANYDTDGNNAVNQDNNKEFRRQFAVGLMLGMPHPYGSGTDMGLFNWDEESGGGYIINNKPAYRYKWLGTATDTAAIRQSTAGTDLLSTAGATWNVVVKTGYSAQDMGSIAVPPVAGTVYSSGTTSTFTPNANTSIRITMFPSNTNKPDYNGVMLKLNPATPLSISPDSEYTLTFEARATGDYTLLGKSFNNTPFQICVGGFAGYQAYVLADLGWRTNTLSFKATNTPKGITFGIGETAGTVMFRNIKLKPGSSDRFSRTFQHGKVFLNMSKDSWNITLPASPAYNYLQNTLKHPDGTKANPKNSGLPVGTSLVVAPYDAVFLINTNSYY